MTDRTMKKPTKKQVLIEADTLETMKPNIRQFSSFGDDHHEAIDAQINMLRQYANDELFSEEEVESEYEDAPENVQSSARDAFLWADGSDDYEGDYGTPAEQWKSLIIKKVATPKEKRT